MMRQPRFGEFSTRDLQGRGKYTQVPTAHFTRVLRIGLTEPRERLLALWLILPSFVAIALLSLSPLVDSLWLSLHDVDLAVLASQPYVGLRNYTTAVTDPEFWGTLGRTIYFTGVSVGLELLIGLVGAVLLNEEFRGRSVIRSLLLVPWAMLTLSTALMWFWIYNPTYGILNGLLLRLGLLDTPRVWLSDPFWAMQAVVLADVWKMTPFMTLLLLAGLQPIPQELYEAAVVDGATRWRTLRHIIIPLLKPMMLVAVVFRTLQAFKVFDMVYVLTAGGPADTTNVLALYTYRQVFRYLHVGYGSALSWLMASITLILVVAYMRLLRGTTEV